MINPLGGAGMASRSLPTHNAPSVSATRAPMPSAQDVTATRRASTLDALKSNANQARPQASSNSTSTSNSSPAEGEKGGLDLGGMLKKLVDFAKSVGGPLMELLQMGADALRKGMGMISPLASSAMSMVKSFI
ncbi:hypothetical protein [Burkholderia ambifaria]|uniref:Uncharacterized protein n=1 Tax=Burkholderia ambifaria MEX-5 TaxID=396597 RepID=B1T6T9_9BURK|nr:hypothetical protein [Burkholderia ambifaria]EDT40732.1 hypothetical protein BamMEX5DRAFT_3505 [Burkholderia ambifaria MEX-5]